jgi:hypothetical protein
MLNVKIINVMSKGRPKNIKEPFNPLCCRLTDKQLLLLLPTFNDMLSCKEMGLRDLKGFFFMKKPLMVKRNRLLYYLLERIEYNGKIISNWQNVICRNGMMINVNGGKISAHSVANTICKYRDNINGNDYSSSESHSGKPEGFEMIDTLIMLLLRI